ncbi:glycoside hydrolase family 114 protein [Piromyces sp. E2]|nr:glycoside hydrolase family 114 protein [Piromyces sp. E2]|eukprot:OUM60833.1 glycoside hydrolase family 114 protein [Piromyces sp. E2]
MRFSVIASVASLLLASSVKARVSFTPGLTWNYVIGENHFDVEKEKAQVIVVDLHGTKDSQMEKYKKHGKKVICYFSGGSYEHFRPDKEKMKDVSGLVLYDEKLHGWDEYYLDIRKSGLKSIIENRIKEAKKKHCDGIEVDNLDVCSNVKHTHLSASDCAEYAKWLAETAHSYDISIGLKNSKYIADKVAKYYDFAINESCFTHGKYCHKYKEFFLNDNKAVFSIQYNNYLEDRGGKSGLCKDINGLPISMIVKKSQKLIQDGYIVDKKVCGEKFDNGIREVKKTETKTVSTKQVNPSPINAPLNTTANANVNATATATKTTTKTTKDAAKDNKDKKGPTVNVIEKDEGGSGVAAGVAVTAITGSAAAAAAFVFVKKNPKQYENLKRSISHKATTVKRGAADLSRRATQRATDLSRKISKKTPKTNIDPTNESIEGKTETTNESTTNNYRYEFTQQMDGKLNIYE